MKNCTNYCDAASKENQITSCPKSRILKVRLEANEKSDIQPKFLAIVRMLIPMTDDTWSRSRRKIENSIY